jgi:hypothetical protein
MFMIFGIISLIKVNNVEEFSESIGVIPIDIVFIFKSTNFLINNVKIRKVYDDLKSLAEDESWIEKQKGHKLKQRIAQITKVFRIFLSFSLFGVTVSALVAVGNHELVLKMWFPYDYKSNEAFFWLSVFYQITGGFVITPVSILVEFFPVFLICYLTGIIGELRERFAKIGMKRQRMKKAIRTIETLEEMENYEELVKCVKIHQKIVEISSNLNEIFGKDFWFQGFISIAVLCTTSFSLTIVSRLAILKQKLHYDFPQGHRSSSILVTFLLHDPDDLSNPSTLLLRNQLDN